MDMHLSKYKSKVDKIKSIGVLNKDNLSKYEAKETLSNILNKTILKKKPIDFYVLCTDDLEPILETIEKKHNMYIGYILPLKKEKDEPHKHYSFSLRLGNDHLDTVFARTLFEGTCKSLLVLYYYIKLKEDKE